MFGLGMPEIIIILVAVGILLFGSKKIVEVARSLGRFSGEFKKGKQEVDRELKEVAQDSVLEDVTVKNADAGKVDSKKV